MTLTNEQRDDINAATSYIRSLQRAMKKIADIEGVEPTYPLRRELVESRNTSAQ